MTREEIINTPELVDFMLDESIIADSREKLRKRLEEVCNLAIKALEQEPTTKNNLGVDCISRAQALSELKESAEHHSNNSREEALLRRDRDIIRNLPSVTPQPKTGHWIPVSERLPREFESVLVCYKSQGGMAQCVAERLVNMDGNNRWSAMYGQEPIAWMPLPEPYKAESEVRNDS